MKIEVLGCSGGMGLGEFTTCIRINDQFLIDAGSGLGCLSQEEMLKVKRLFITHAHLDHICFLPLLLDNLFEQLSKPLEVHALPKVIQALKTHVFNWSIWPDFTCLPDSENAVLNLNTLTLNSAFTTPDNLTITPIVAKHVVPACGYSVKDEKGNVFCFSGDTHFDNSVVENYNRLGHIDLLMLECAFPNRLQSVADKSQHLTPKSLAKLINALKMPPEALLITHLKPAFRDEIKYQLDDLGLPVKIHLLKSGDAFLL